MADYGATSVSPCPVIRRGMVLYYKRIFVCYAVLMMFYCILAPKIHDCADLWHFTRDESIDDRRLRLAGPD